MRRVFFAETAVFAHFDPVRVIFLVFHRVIVSLFALGTRESDSGSHKKHLLSLSVPVRPA